jgi:hypothetical protein
VTPADRLTWRKSRPGVPRYKWGDYFALSYTWGHRDDLVTISLDGHDFQITSNLNEALTSLRNNDALPQGCFLWVDALCINQDDAKERSLEVNRMQHIYTSALDTVIFLGSGNPAVEEALKFVNVTDGHWQDPASLKKAIQEYLKTASLDIWDNIAALLMTVPYWWRQWVMQEMAAGSEEKPMYYQSTHTTSILMWSVFNYFNQRKRYSFPESIAFWSVVEEFPDHYRRLLEVEPFDKPGPIGIRKFAFQGVGVEKWNTYQVLSTARKNRATDPRDCVYGLLGLLDKSLVSKIKVDYEADINQVYTDFTKTVIDTENSLEILGQCDYFGLPTWVPRLNVNFPYYRHPHHEAEAPAAANGGTKAEARFEERPGGETGTLSLLHTTAVLFDRLNNENRLYKGGYADDTVPSTGVENAYGSLAALREALWRTLGGNRDVVGVIPAPADYSILLSTEVFENQYHFNPLVDNDDSTPNPFAEWARKNADLKIAGIRLADLFETAGLADLPEDERKQRIKAGTDASKRFINATWSRRVAVTEKGYLCYVPWHAERGDVVAVFPGCSFPVLLRPVPQIEGVDEKLFKVVNPCYLHGVMEGEVFSSTDRVGGDNHKLEKVVLI